MKLKQIEITEVYGIVCNPCLNAGGVKEQHGRWMPLEFHQG